eukprot:3765040-Ditylum_brightwellii.AAC.2
MKTGLGKLLTCTSVPEEVQNYFREIVSTLNTKKEEKIAAQKFQDAIKNASRKQTIMAHENQIIASRSTGGDGKPGSIQ